MFVKHRLQAQNTTQDADVGNTAISILFKATSPHPKLTAVSLQEFFPQSIDHTDIQGLNHYVLLDVYFFRTLANISYCSSIMIFHAKLSM